MSFARNLCSKYGKQLLDTATKARLDALETASKIVAHKAAEEAGEVIGNKFFDEIVKTKLVPDENSRNVEEIVILPEKSEEILWELRQLLNEANISKFFTKKWIEVNDLSGGQDSVNTNTRFKKSMPRSDLCDYSDVNIVAKETTDVLEAAASEKE